MAEFLIEPLEVTQNLEHPASLATISVSGAATLPAIVRAAGVQASKRYFEYFTVTIRNAHTREGYFRACRVFFEWCEKWGLTLETIEAIHVAAYIESRAKSDDPQGRLSKTSIKQHASALRKMFSYFVEKVCWSTIRRARWRPKKCAARLAKRPPSRWRTWPPCWRASTLRTWCGYVTARSLV